MGFYPILEAQINFLLKQALKQVMLMPVALIIDKWRWSVYRGEISPEEYNLKWWKMREKYEGIKTPVERSEDDFDPGHINHVATNSPTNRLIKDLKDHTLFFLL